jgi:predicted PurR-regulated permease PerM
VAGVAAPPVEPARDAAHMRAREAALHYAPAEPRALGILALLAFAAIVAVVLPVGVGVLLGTLLAFTTHGAYRELAHRTRRPSLVALATTLVITAGVAGMLVLLASVLVLQGVAVLSGAPQWFAPGGAAARIVQRAAEPLAVLGMQPSDVVDRVRGALGGVAASLAGWAAQILGTVFDGILALTFMALTMYVVLRRGTELARRAEHLMPINPHHTRRLLREVRRLGRTVVIGNFGTALVQGAIASAGYAIARVPGAAFFGVMTAVASLVPAFGTMLVWVPAAILLVLGGHLGRGVFVLVWGTIAVVGLCDYVVRPKLVGRGEGTSVWMTFVALFGGIKLFGVIGLLLGPLLVGVAVAVLRLYERTRRFRLGLS